MNPEVSKQVPFAEFWRPGRIVSLWDMKDYGARFLYETGAEIRGLEDMLLLWITPGIPKDAKFVARMSSPSFWKKMIADVTAFGSACRQLGFTSVADKCDSIIENELRPPFQYNKAGFIHLNAQLYELRDRFKGALKGREFFILDPGDERFYRELQFPEEQRDMFFDAIFDMEEAGKCYALDRWTACVFHLSRVIECALGAVGKKFGFDYSPSWETVLRRMRDMRDKKREGAKNKKLSANVAKGMRDDAKFLANIEAEAHAIKEGWRNPTIHDPAQKYNDAEAERIFKATQGFMLAVFRGLSQNESSS